MSATAASSNPCLIAILLIIQARAGDTAQIIYHYPPDPFKHDESKLQSLEAAEAESSSDSDSDSSSDDAFEVISPQDKGKGTGSNTRKVTRDPENSRIAKVSRSDRAGDDDCWKPPWDPLLGLGDENLVSLLAPGRTWHKRKFEMGINDLIFVGRPVYAREDGTWARQHRRKATKTVVSDSDLSPRQSSDTDTTIDPKPSTPSSSRSKDSKSKRALTMFHLVFVLNPPPLEQTQRVKDIYEFVAKKLSKVLKLEQARNNYVWEQAELMQQLKASQLTSNETVDSYYTHVIRHSSLANAVSTTFRSILQSRVAAIRLSPKASISMQIPPVTSTPYLPSPTEPPIKPGLWLTTANETSPTSSDLDTATASSTLHLAKNFTLLLLEPPARILKELQSQEASAPLVLAMTSFLDKLRSTKSFYKISTVAKISLADIQLLAQHLIYWRRAVAIPPLHHRDTYIVSPNADMSQLVTASKAFEAAFPMLPSLARFLHLLSQTPVPFGMLIPTADHKEEYYRVLAWLMRGGWITQLRTFAYVRIDKAVKKNVREQDKQAAHEAKIERLDSTKEEFTNGHTNGDAAPFPSSTAFHKRPSIVSRPSSDGRQSTASNQPRHNPNAASIIMSPLRATGEESRWLAHIADRLLHESTSDRGLSDEEQEEVKKHWDMFVKYFNGHEALEKIPIREGLKRKFVWEQLGKMGLDFDDGVRGKNSDSEEGRVLVTVRHW